MQETQETWVRSLGGKASLKKGMATHSSVLTWRIPWTEEPGRLQSIVLHRVKHDWSDLAGLHCCTCFSFSSCGEWGLLFSWCTCFSLWWPLLCQSRGSRCVGSVVTACGPSCFAACDPPGPGIEPLSPALAGKLSAARLPEKPYL